jgi:serine/threonine protein kinase
MDSLLDLEETTDDPLLNESKDERWSAWLFQIISALTVAQYHYGFVHNDLHTNNIMWCGTEEEYLYYKLDAKTFYRVPTYGNLMKIIDFGRASFFLKDRDQLLITDSFDDGNDAAGQYNCPPFYDKKEPRVDPNPSFDLCRLAVSMFDALYPDHPGIKTPEKVVAEEQGRISYESSSELYNILWSWLTDEKGKNILRNPDDSERFPDFDLYKHIGRYAKNSIPRIEAKRPYFEKLYRIEKEKIPRGVKIWEIPLE